MSHSNKSTLSWAEAQDLWLEAAKRSGYDQQESHALWNQWLYERMGWGRSTAFLHASEALEPAVYSQWHLDMSAIEKGTPLQYILGRVVFAGLTINVTPGVLIPRPETEAWITQWSKILPSGVRVLDACTGSGCMALALKAHNPSLDVWALDDYEEALVQARGNAARLNLLVRIEKADLLAEVPQDWPLFDAIFSNPPYIPWSEKSQMDRHVVEHEPSEALFVPDADPILFYRALSRWGNQKLVSGGVLAVECHRDLVDNVCGLWRSEGWEKIVVENDIFDQKRFVSALRPPYL